MTATLSTSLQDKAFLIPSRYIDLFEEITKINFFTRPSDERIPAILGEGVRALVQYLLSSPAGRPVVIWGDEESKEYLVDAVKRFEPSGVAGGQVLVNFSQSGGSEEIEVLQKHFGTESEKMLFLYILNFLAICERLEKTGGVIRTYVIEDDFTTVEYETPWCDIIIGGKVQCRVTH